MKNIFTLFTFVFCSIFVNSQETVTIQLAGVSAEAAKQMSASGDRISWYTLRGSDKLVSNISVELSNVGEKQTDRERGSVQADPDANGMYNFSSKVEVKLKKVDKTKPVHIEVVIETIMGNELFYMKDLDFSAVSEPITLNGYTWRATNEKVGPKKDLCIEYSSFISDKDVKKQFSDIEGSYKFDRSDFVLYLKQGKDAEWVQLTDKIQGGFANSNKFNLTHPMPSWIDPTKELLVRFAAKTPKLNYVWGEYSVQPHEYRKEYRAENYNSIPFDPSSKPNTSNAQAENKPIVEEKQVEANVEKQLPVKPSVKAPEEKKDVAAEKAPDVKAEVKEPAKPTKKTGGILLNAFDETIASADSLFADFKYAEAKTKYEEASKIKPAEKYPKDQAAICLQKLQAIKDKKSPMKGGMK
ncbi:MAG: hypothetical protein WED33_09095 [Bacteroidia bacterium]